MIIYFKQTFNYNLIISAPSFFNKVFASFKVIPSYFAPVSAHFPFLLNATLQFIENISLNRFSKVPMFKCPATDNSASPVGV